MKTENYKYISVHNLDEIKNFDVYQSKVILSCDGENHILARFKIQGKLYACLISTKDGNRWVEPVHISDERCVTEQEMHDIMSPKFSLKVEVAELYVKNTTPTCCTKCGQTLPTEKKEKNNISSDLTFIKKVNGFEYYHNDSGVVRRFKNGKDVTFENRTRDYRVSLMNNEIGNSSFQSGVIEYTSTPYKLVKMYRGGPKNGKSNVSAKNAIWFDVYLRNR